MGIVGEIFMGILLCTIADAMVTGCISLIP